MFQFAAAVPCQKHAKNCVYGITAPFLRWFYKHLFKIDSAAVIPQQFDWIERLSCFLFAYNTNRYNSHPCQISY